MKRRIFINGFLIFVSTMLILSLHKFTIPHWRSDIIDELLDIFGLTLLVFGQVIRVCARGYKAYISSKGNTLISDGPYAFVRNPMYIGSFFIGTGIVLMLFKWWIIFPFLFLFLFRFLTQVAKEEKCLFERFGNRYLAYAKSVPKFFPPFSRWAVFHRFFPFKWQWLNKEITSIVVTFLLVLMIEAYEDIRLFGGLQLLKEISLFISVVASFVIVFYFLYTINKKVEGESLIKKGRRDEKISIDNSCYNLDK